jgi:HD-GYP domain-containing protein (c-di-GMP phosphodiesterase class II)
VLKTINSSTRTLVLQPDINRVLEQTLKPIVEVLGFDRALVMTVDETGKFLEYRYGFGEELERIERLRDYRVPLDREQNLMIRVFKRRRPVLIRDVKAAGLNPTNRILQDFRPSAFVVCPLIAEGRTIGILGVDRRTTVAPITSGDVEYLSIFANNIASAFQRQRLDQDLRESYEERTRIEQRRSEELKQSYEGAVSALVKAIEVNDTYTGDHSDRVSKISVKIARRLGYDESQLDDIRFGCILHDVGKIGLASYLELQKDGPLTAEEYEKIKEHPVRGEQILQANAFFKQNHRTIVRNHHERWDGKGYPDGLAGDLIPPEAQIVAVADAFDAMTSDRRYRKGMPVAQAVAEIVRCTGTQFSRWAVEAFLQVYEAHELNGEAAWQKR